jgi:hypothetical protein
MFHTAEGTEDKIFCANLAQQTRTQQARTEGRTTAKKEQKQRKKRNRLDQEVHENFSRELAIEGRIGTVSSSKANH